LKDVGSGLNPKRPNFTKMLKLINNRDVAVIIITYRDRLTRFGFEYLESYFQSHNAKILVLNQEEIQDPQKELVADLIAIITSFSGKIYGLRSHKTKNLIRNVRAEFHSK
jgi:putative resolvase